MSRFFIILIILVAYTSFKAMQLWPSNRYAAAALVLPFFALMIGWNFLYRANPSIFNSLWFEILAWTGCLIMSGWATFIILSIPIDVFHLLVTLFRRFASTSHDAERREFLSQGFRYGLLGASGGLAAMGLIGMVRGPRVKEVNLSYANLPQDLKNLKIVQISDLHVGPTIREGYVNEIVTSANALEPDLIFVTGDLADGKVVDLARHMAPLGNLKSKYGIYYVTGNHEYYWGAQDLLDLCKTFGFTSLLNENTIIPIGNTKLMIAGITDIVGGKFIPTHEPNIEKANTTTEKPDFKILLAHRPEAYVQAKDLGFDLQCSGHTHSGQFFPFNLLVPLVHKHYKGLTDLNGLQLYVNPGTGYWGPPNRFAVPSEITLLRLS